MGGKVTMNVTNIDQYGDLEVLPKSQADQLELEFNYYCRIVYKVTGQVLFEVSGATAEECKENALTVVMSLLTDWNTLSDSQKESSSLHVKHLVGALEQDQSNQIEYQVS